MGMRSLIKGIQRGTTTEVDLKSGVAGDLNMSQFLPKYAQLCAAGKVFAFDMSAGTAIKPVIAMPTTSPEWSVYNGYTTAHIVLLKVACIQSSGTSGLGLTILATAAKGEQTAATANYASSIVSCLDGSASVPTAYLQNNVTLVGGTPAWVPLATTELAANGPVGKGLVADAEGLIIAPPHGAIGIEFYAPVGNLALFDCMVVIAVIDLDTA